MRRGTWGVLVAASLVTAACSGDNGGQGATSTSDAPSAQTTAAPTTDPPVDPTVSTTNPVAPAEDVVLVGAASRSVLPTVDDARFFLSEAPGWDDLDPNDPGVFVPSWDQGRVDVGNGDSDGSWVHDDLRATAVALAKGDERVVLATADVYMIFALDAVEIERRARQLMPPEWAEGAEIVISATHNHHGPDSAFNINDEWYDLMADEMAAAMAEATTLVEPAVLAVASGEHGFGVFDVRDPVIIDPRLNVLTASSAETGDVIATVVQWTAHPEVTLGWTPDMDPDALAAACEVKGWTGDDCSANGRYFTADFPGVMRERVQAELGGEVLFFNGALGNQIGPGRAPVWLVSDEHPVGDGFTAPDGAPPVPGCDSLLCRNLARTEAIGSELAKAVIALADVAEPFEVPGITLRTQPFYTPLTNIGFRLLLADGDLGWQEATLYNCAPRSEAPLSDDTCVDDGGALESDPLLDALVGSQIRKGDVIKTQISHLSLGEVGFLFMPGELPPELVIGVPTDFDTSPERYYLTPELHAVGADYDFPGYLLSLVDERVTFTVGLGGDELGYWVPAAEYRLKCLDIVLPAGASCESLFADGHIEYADAIGGLTCQRLWNDPAAVEEYPADVGPALMSICRYGQALGRELGEPDGHYEETNAAGWDLVDDTWAAAVALFGRDGTGRVNPSLPTGGWLSR
jgi:hypothetical protein